VAPAPAPPVQIHKAPVTVKPTPAPPSTAQRVSKLLTDANASLARKDYAQAGKLANEALALDPANEAAQALKKKAQQGAWSEVQIQ
jgi:hypothetical protein